MSKNLSHWGSFVASIVIILTCFGHQAACSKKDVNKNTPSNILVLDSLMNHIDDFTLDRLTRIEEIKQKRRVAKSISEKYLYDNLLFENFYTLNADSALLYVNKCIKKATKAGNKEWCTQSRINKASLLTATGLLMGALDIMNEINTNDLSKGQLIEYYGQMVDLYRHLGNFIGKPNNPYYVTERIYKDSVMKLIEPSHPEYLWYKGWDIMGTQQNPDSIIDALKERLENSKLNERKDAREAYLLAKLYEKKGDVSNYEQYMALSAIVDVKIANAEIASMEELARTLFDNGNGDVDRAYRYINYSLDKSLSYPNRNRAFGILELMGEINTAYQQQFQNNQKRTNVFLVLFCVLAFFLLLSIFGIFRRNRKFKRQGKDLAMANNQLQTKVKALSEAEKQLNDLNNQLIDLNRDLKQKNAQLYEANFVKEEYIGYVFKMCSGYIDQIEDFKKTVYLKAMKKQWEDLENLTSDLDMKDEVKEFYQAFDTIFLNLYPNFVSDFNALLKPDKQIVLKEGELLNMELRIYALVRLGITDSVKIADFLHCAPQTVYNYRLRARSRTTYSKQEFMDNVKSIGNFLGKEDNDSNIVAKT
ncbi:MAG: transcriptional regulator [Muribaculaceae bacterium]|nr:transcriptional regulator [Muribaculaceae bacterium]